MFWLNINVNVSLISFEYLKSSQRTFRHLDTQGSQTLGHLGTYPVDIGCKLNVNKKTPSERLMYVQFTSCAYGVEHSGTQSTQALEALYLADSCLTGF